MTGTTLKYAPTHTAAKRVLRFGSFELRPLERVLSRDGQPIALGDRALDLLLILIERPGELVTKEELIARAWPRRVVEEVNLRINIAALRRALGDGRSGIRYIVNVIGNGYSFVGEVSLGSALEWVAHERAPVQNTLPVALSYLVGRVADIEAVEEMLERRRLVTIIGVGGVGKSAVAVATATSHASAYRDGVCFVDLTPIGDAALVPLSLATALGVAVDPRNPLPMMGDYLREKDMLLILDNCEHLVDAVAELVESLLRMSYGLRILATSQEPLRTPGEGRHRLRPLETPPATETLGRLSARSWTAMELFVDRARCADQSFQLTDANAALVGSICRSLDGLPLAIELAAARVGSMELGDLVARLQQSAAPPDRRTSVAHHQTLRATLDWSHALLSDRERIVLRRLAVFRGPFSSALAVGVCAQDGLIAEEAMNALLSLVDRSLISTECSGEQVLHRLLNTMRDFAVEKLMQSPDASDIFRWHAEEVARQLRQAELDWNTMIRTEWLRAYEHLLEDIRAAVEWALSFNGNASLAAQLTLAAVPFGYQLALTEEFVALVQQTLEALARQSLGERALEERLKGALLHLRRHLIDGGEVRADQMPAPDAPLAHQISLLINETIDRIEAGQYAEALECARDIFERARANSDPAALLVAKRVMAQATHFHGDHTAARRLAEGVLNSPAAPPLRYVPTAIHPRVSMRIILARILWVEGHADRAKDTAQRALEYAEADNPFALCQVLALASCPIAMWRGDTRAAASLIVRLDDCARRYRLERWRAYALHYAACEAASGNGITNAGEEPDASRGLLTDMLLTLGSRHVRLTDEDLAPARRLCWCGPELLRLQAERQIAQAGMDAWESAEAKLLLALDLAEQQNALAWRLRAALALAEMWKQVNRRRDARALLTAVYGRFSEGHGTRDLARAQQLVACLEDAPGASS
jgi:predicted ATPase/DNA-binding winged helix-turn-helix (wHTH) protein